MKIKINIYEQWLKFIKENIQSKYKIADPIFWISGNKVESSALLRTLEDYAVLPDLWLKYKRIKDNAFELKCYFPNPSFDVCERLINEALNFLKIDFEKSFFTVSFDDFENDTPYTYKEIKKELLYLLREGLSKIIFAKEPTTKKDKIIYHLWVEYDSLENMLKTGYLNLE